MSFSKYLKGLSLFAIACFSMSQANAAKKPVVLNVQVGEEIRYLDPQIATGMSSSAIGVNLFTTLYQYGHKDGEPVNNLAISAKSNADSTVWTFKLKKNVPFVKVENGKVVKKRYITAHDVVYSFQRILDPKTASEYSYMLYVLKNGEEFNKGKIKDRNKVGVKALDDHTVQLTMKGSVPTFVQYLPHQSFAIVPKEPIEKYKEKWITKENIWTSGPFAFKDWKLKDRIVAIKNPYYPYAKDVQVDKVNFIFIGTYSPESVRAFRAGKIDIDYEPPPTSEIAPLKKSKHLRASRLLGTYFIRVNVTRGPLKDPKVRRALALTVPRKRLVKYVMKSGEIPTLSFVPNAFKGYKVQRFTNERNAKKRIAEAKRLLAEAGYPNGKGFPQIKYLYNTAENHKKIAVVLSKEWKKHLGIDIIPFNQEWKVYLNTQKSIDYDISRSGWIADMADPMNFVEMFITGGGNNNTGFSNKEYDQLIKQARGEKDLNKRNKIMERAENILMAELPVIPLFNYTSLNLVHNYVTGFYANKMDRHPLKYVKVDTNKRKKTFKKLKR